MQIARKRAGLTQEEVGERLGGASRTRVSEWERDWSIPDSRYLLQLPDVLNVSPDWLFYGRAPSGLPIPSAEAVEALRAWMDQVLPPREAESEEKKEKKDDAAAGDTENA